MALSTEEIKAVYPLPVYNYRVTILNGQVGADALVDVIDIDVSLPREIPADLLVRSVLLIRPARIAVEGEEGF